MVIAVSAALTLYLLQPSLIPGWLQWTVVVLCVAIMVALVCYNPSRFDRQSVASRTASVLLAFVLLAANQLALAGLILDLVNSRSTDGPGLLVDALQVWTTNVIAYAIVFWELDRGGPVARRRAERSAIPVAAFRFPQDENHEAVAEVAATSSKTAGWTPEFLDYLYFSATNAMSFSPSDTMPLTRWAKAVMLIEAFSGFVILALVIARAVNVLA